MGALDGKRIVVTGASRGLGRAFARALASEEAQVVVNGTNDSLLREVVAEINAAKSAADAGKPPPPPSALGFGSPDDVAPVVVCLCSDRASHLRSQMVTFNGSELVLWSHPHETILDRRPTWNVDELAGELDAAAEPVHVVEY